MDKNEFILLMLCGLIFTCVVPAMCMIISFIRSNFKMKFQAKSSDGKITTTTTPVSLLEVRVTLPMKVIFEDKMASVKYESLPELAQIPKTRLGEGTLGTLFKVVLNCGSIVTIRKIREGLVNAADLELWINFFGAIRDACLLPIQFSFWYGGEAFIVYHYLCLGSLDELLHGSEGIQFTPFNYGIRKEIALCAAKAVASIHSRVTKNGEALVCGVIKASNLLIRADFSACLSSYEMPYLVPPATIIRRNPSRVAPELRHPQAHQKVFTQKSDVYSFGILLLELITGERPSVTNLGEYILEKRKEEGLKGIYDKRMGDVKENIMGMIGIARLCLLGNPQDRPSMDKVVQLIEDLQELDFYS